MINILIVHYNTPKLTECLVKSINKFVGTDCNIYIFDNSDKLPFTYKQDNITVFDNTRGQIINFNNELKKYPNHKYSLGSRSGWGSFKHCISVDKCFDLINDNFILLDSDILLRKDISNIFDEDYYACGDLQDWSWSIGNKSYPVHKRLLPFVTFINVKKAKQDNIRYFNAEHMDGLYDSTHHNRTQLEKDSWDTGCWFYEKIKNKKIKFFNHEDYIVHFRGGSYTRLGRNESMTQEQWLYKYRNFYEENNKNKKVIYTCITGGYDSLIEPVKITPDYDYICFTDDMSLSSNTWIIKPLPEETKNLDNARKNRYIKTHPHTLLSEYETSIYVDGSIKVTGDLNMFIKTCDLENYCIAIPKHPCRVCSYKEGKACILIKKDTAENINPQMERYRKEGFPENYGLTQNNIIVRKHNDENCIRIMDTWWTEILNGSHRDQLSLFYVLWKNQDVKIKQLPSNVCNSIYFKWNPIHSRRKNTTKPVKPVSQTQQEINEAKAEIEKLQQQIAVLKRRLNAVKQTPTINTPTMSVLYNRETENGVATQKRNITNNIVIRQKKRVNKSNMRTFF